MRRAHERRIWGERYVEDTASGTTVAPHTHELAFLACLDAGLIELRTDSEAWVVFPKTVTFVPEGFKHSVQAMSTEIRGWILYLPRTHARRLGTAPRVVEMSDLFLAVSSRIVQWGPSRSPTPRQTRLMAVALDELENARLQRTFRLPLPRDSGLLRACEAVLAAPSDMTAVDHWARHAGMSRRSFTRHFSEQTGLAFGVWRHRVKIHEALRLLADGASVTTVGFEVGYRSTSSFIAMFRKCVGTSPARFARNVIDDDSSGLAPRAARDRLTSQ